MRRSLSLTGLAVLMAFDVWWLSHAACRDPMTPTDHVLVGTEAEQDVSCVETYKGRRAETDACRASVKAAWDAYWQAHFDGGADR